MTRMHKNEYEITISLVKTLLENQCPKWSQLPLAPIASSGTDNALFRLGENYVVRLPRVEWAPGSVKRGIDKEYEWVPKLARHLKMSISEPLFKGIATSFYPWPWSITQWNSGQNPDFEKGHEYEQLAKDLADFLNDLQKIKLNQGPLSRRGIPLQKVNNETKKAIKQLESDSEFNTTMISSMWDELSNTPPWKKNLVWVHGDLLPGNILIQNNRLSAVIDFADVGRGDPACDLIIAWSLLNPFSREIFRAHLQSIDDHTWKRGKGWALSIALIILPYYRNTNPALTAVAERIIEQVIYDEDL